MLQSRNLDNQNYAQIMEAAMNRLPTMCPEWTNYNESDPGVTILQLFAWYKEMQQYHLDQMTEELRRKLLKLVGEEPRGACAAECCVELPAREKPYLEQMGLITEEGIPFELAKTVQGNGPRMTGVYIAQNEKKLEITDILSQSGAAVQPFLHGGRESELEIHFSGVGGEARLWFEVERDERFPRTAFASRKQTPRTICWTYGGKEIEPKQDDTHALSISGFVTFRLPDTETGGILRAELTDPGCEEIVRLTAISDRRCPAVQRETWGKRWAMKVPDEAGHVVELEGELSQRCLFTVFIRRASGWEQLPDAQELQTQMGQRLTLDCSGALQDGKENLWIIGSELSRAEGMFFASSGLPEQSLPVLFEGRRPAGGPFELVCDSLMEDGSVKPAVWHRVNDFYASGPRDRVFVYDELRESINFGDGGHGAIVPRGEGAILISQLSLSDCGAGNIPGGMSLYIKSEGALLRCTDASGGADPESAAEASSRFLKSLSKSEKCASAEDYARIARQTPGLRVAIARAIPGYDPQEPTGKSVKPIVSVVVVPYSQTKRPVPNKSFLEAVTENLESRRMICVSVKALPPHYIGLGIQARVRAGESVSEEGVFAAIEKWLDVFSGHREIGQAISESEVESFLQSLPEVLRVERVRLTARTPGCRASASGELQLPPDGIVYLEQLSVEKI